MARAQARVFTSIWSNPDFTGLTERAQRLYLLILSQPNLSYAGVLPFTLKRWACLAADSTTKALERCLAELLTARFVLYDSTTDELMVRSFLRHDGVLKSPNLCRAMVRDYNAVLSKKIREAIAKEVPRPVPEPFSKGFPEGFPEPFRTEVGEGFSEGFPREPLPPNPSLSPSSGPSPAPATTPERAALVERILRMLGERDADKQGKRGHRGYVTACVQARKHDHSSDLHKLIHDNPGLTADQYADMIDAPTEPTGPPKCPHCGRLNAGPHICPGLDGQRFNPEEVA